jgi:hypothetical protein
MHRRAFLSAGVAALATPALAQHQHHRGQFERLNQPGRTDLPDLAQQHAVTDSPAPRAAVQGRWQARAPLPIPRTEMAWAAGARGACISSAAMPSSASTGPITTSTTQAADSWIERRRAAARRQPCRRRDPRRSLYAIGGFIEQNRRPHAECFVFDGERWTRIRPLPSAAAPSAASRSANVIHAIGGAEGDMSETRRSLDWHLVYEPQARTAGRSAGHCRPGATISASP